MRKTAPSGVSPIAALTEAFSETIQVLLNPFDLVQWIKFSAVCLLLGGGASWAAIHTSLRALPGNLGLERVLQQLRTYAAGEFWLSLTLALIGVGLGITLIYLRAVCRFTLVDSILRSEVRWHHAWAELHPVAGTYFRWLLAALFMMGVMLAGGTFFALPLLRSSESQPLVLSLALAAVVLFEVLAAVAMGLAITLTDDLVVPIMYAERLTLPAAWRALLAIMRADTGAFVLYVLLRFVVAVGIGVAVLFLLFPALVALFSGAMIFALLVLLGLEQLGVHWVWTPLTTLVAGAAILLLVGLLLAVMALAGMPGQVFLQTFGMRFVTPRVPALQALWNERRGTTDKLSPL